VGETPVPDIAGSVVPGGKVAGELGIVVPAATTRSEDVPVNDRAPEALASAEMCARSPAAAVDRTGTVACSSAACPTGRVPTAHVAVPGSGQIVKVGLPTNRPPLVLALTDTARLVALVDQTQMTNVASWPTLTSPAPESGWIRTHSCGVTFLGFGFLGFGLDELGFGEGELDLEVLGVGLGVVVVLGLGVVVAGVDDAAPDEDVEPEADVVGLDEGLSLVDVADELAGLVDFADEPADLSFDAEELASAAERSCLAALLVAPESTVLLGMSGHAAELMIDLLLASAACSSANILQPMNAKPVSAPIAAGLRISALTCESSCTVWLR
jgi:hypothetical protein